ncbi:hypothetical protein ACFVUW_25025 [Streptomyces xiamenensis]
MHVQIVLSGGSGPLDAVAPSEVPPGGAAAPDGAVGHRTPGSVTA